MNPHARTRSKLVIAAALAGLLIVPRPALAADPTPPLPSASPQLAPAMASPIPSVRGVPVRFAPADGGTYIVTVSGAVSGSCQAPCVLELAPGLTTIKIAGDVTLTQNVSIPYTPAVISIKKGSPGVRGFGMTLFVLGSLGGIYLTATESSDASVGVAKARFELAVADLALIVIGAIVTLSADRAGVELHSEGVSHRETARPVRFAGIGAAPAPGGAVLAASLSF